MTAFLLTTLSFLSPVVTTVNSLVDVFSSTHTEITYTYFFSNKKRNMLYNVHLNTHHLDSTTNILLNYITYSSISLSTHQSIFWGDPFESKLQTSVYFLPPLPSQFTCVSAMDEIVLFSVPFQHWVSPVFLEFCQYEG